LCLDRSRIVGVILTVIQIVWLTLTIIDSFDIHAERTLSGQCDRTSHGMSPIMVILQCFQSFFISCCFVYAVWKSSGLPAVRGRISLRLASMDDLDEAQNHPGQSNVNYTHQRRGWWDYVPGNEKPIQPLQRQPVNDSQASGFSSIMRYTVKCFRRSPDDSKIFAGRKPSIHSEFPLPQPSRPPAVRISQNSASTTSDPRGNFRAHSPSPSFSSQPIIGLRPRMVLLREVMRDELCYTTFITTLCVVVTVIAVAGVNIRMALNVAGWLMLNWVVISLLAVHSFGRVVERHEIEAMMQHPWSWDYSFQTDRRAAETSRRARSSGPRSPRLSIPSFRARRNTAFGSLDQDPDGGDAEMRLYLHPHSKTDDSVSISHSSLPSPAPSIGGESVRVPLRHAPRITPSPSTEEFQISYCGFNSSTDTHSPEPHKTVFTPADLPFR